MLELKGIKKDYPAGSGVVHALKGIDLQFRKSEFVSILGPSGCGKTTMLNIIGGLDGYTEGDLVINGTSTKEYKDRDWDTYRNHSVGFVFQSYNLIPHQTVLQNVEIALTLSGVSKAERRERAKAALEQVGLGDQLDKRPGAMSGGQMQRVAIARALVNDPDIILADEPTGALDTVTSVQVMDILKEVSKDRLVVMVTHNPELAEAYSTRIIRMLDGVIVQDSAPLNEEEIKTEDARCMAIQLANEGKTVKMPTMSFATSFMLSLKNLFTKKGRTTLTAFAGSIGIIGIALILAVSQGMTAYINHVQESTLSSYPLTLESQAVDMTAMLESFMSEGSEFEHEKDAIYKDPVIADMVNALSKVEASENDLKAFKTYLETELAKEKSDLKTAVSGVQYTYALSPIVYTKNADGEIIKSDTNQLMMEMIGDFMVQISTGESGAGDMSGMMSGTSGMSSAMMSSMMGLQMWQELLPGLEEGDPINNVLEEQYDVIYGAWPNDANEIVLVVNEKNELDDLTLYALGLLSKEEIDAIIDAAASGKELPIDTRSWSYEEICDMTFKVILPYDTYKLQKDGTFADKSEDPIELKLLYDRATELRVVGIIRPSEDAENTMLKGAIGYTHMLTEQVIEDAANSDVVKAQLADPSVDVLTGLPFESNTGTLTDEEKETEFRAYMKSLDTKSKAAAYLAIQCLTVQLDEKTGVDAQVNQLFASSEMQNKDAIVAMISSALAEQGSVNSEDVEEYLKEYSLEELHDMIRPSMEERVKSMIEAQIRGIYASMTEEQLADMLDAAAAGFTTEQCALYYDEITEFSDLTYEEVLTTIGRVDLDSPATVNLYASSFEHKDVIVDAISAYNDSVEEEKQIAYTDFLGIMMSSITIIIQAITYVLIAFVAISLIVSSIMIGVITLISVQERTKEIGILRAIGASKKNVSSMFNAETMIIGLASGVLGVAVTYVLCLPINLIMHAVTGIYNLNAFLPPLAALILIAISVGLTLISGIIPSRSAAKKDPVVALRSE